MVGWAEMQGLLPKSVNKQGVAAAYVHWTLTSDGDLECTGVGEEGKKEEAAPGDDEVIKKFENGKKPVKYKSAAGGKKKAGAFVLRCHSIRDGKSLIAILEREGGQLDAAAIVLDLAGDAKTWSQRAKKMLLFARGDDGPSDDGGLAGTTNNDREDPGNGGRGSRDNGNPRPNYPDPPNPQTDPRRPNPDGPPPDRPLPEPMPRFPDPGREPDGIRRRRNTKLSATLHRGGIIKSPASAQVKTPTELQEYPFTYEEIVESNQAWNPINRPVEEEVEEVATSVTVTEEGAVLMSENPADGTEENEEAIGQEMEDELMRYVCVEPLKIIGTIRGTVPESSFGRKYLIGKATHEHTFGAGGTQRAVACLPDPSKIIGRVRGTPPINDDGYRQRTTRRQEAAKARARARRLQTKKQVHRQQQQRAAAAVVVKTR